MNNALARFTRLVGALSDASDASLIEAFLAGNQLAFRELVERHAALVFGVCNRILRHRQDAEDAFQAVFVVLARRAADVWPRDALGSWLYGVSTRVALKARTQRQRRQAREQSLADAAAPESHVAEPDTIEVVDRLLRKLPTAYRAAIVACDLEGLSRKEAATRLGWAEGTLSGRLYRARKLLADRLRQTGIALPASGLAAVLGTDSTVRAGVIVAATNFAATGASIPARIEPLTHGVASGMCFAKLKLTVAAVLVASALGFGAWTAGAGDEPGSTPSPGARSPQDAVRLRDELKKLEEEVVALAQEARKSGDNPSADLNRRIAQAEDRLAALRRLMAETRAKTAADTAPALDPLQGRWRIVLMSEGKSPPSEVKKELIVEINGNTLRMPYQESTGALKQEEYKIAVDDKKTPHAIDLIKTGRPVGHGIYAFTASASFCAKCHQGPLGKPAGEPRAEAVQATDAFERLANEHFEEWLRGANDVHLWNAYNICQPGLKGVRGLRLAFALNGIQRPAKFEPAEGVIEFVLARLPESKPEKFEPLPPVPVKPSPPARASEAEGALLSAIEGEAAAQANVKLAEAEMARARANLEYARKQVEAAKARVAAAQSSQKANPPGEKPGAGVTILVRPLLSAEVSLPLDVKRAQTVLEGLAYAAKEMAIKPSTVSVWVVRDRKVLPVNLAGITEKGDSTTNYALQPGDKLFVQEKQ